MSSSKHHDFVILLVSMPLSARHATRTERQQQQNKKATMAQHHLPVPWYPSDIILAYHLMIVL
eukprot:scaffold2735_cov61-Attheya_sp.AAC.2